MIIRIELKMKTNKTEMTFKKLNFNIVSFSGTGNGCFLPAEFPEIPQVQPKVRSSSEDEHFVNSPECIE